MTYRPPEAMKSSKMFPDLPRQDFSCRGCKTQGCKKSQGNNKSLDGEHSGGEFVKVESCLKR
jgi:hypothetical protein